MATERGAQRGIVGRAAALLLAALACATLRAEPLAVPIDSGSEAARLVAEVFIAGRSVVAQQQSVINDPDRKDGGLSPDYFRRRLMREFERNSGRSPDTLADPQVRAVVRAAIDAAVGAVESSQAMINAPNRAFKGFIPALFGRLTGQLLKASTGIVVKQTTFIPRNDYNTPDDYELAVLARFKEARPKSGSGEQIGKRFRYLTPLYIEATCLQCHGEPKGALDMTGRAMEGYKLGELRGAISVDLALR